MKDRSLRYRLVMMFGMVIAAFVWGYSNAQAAAQGCKPVLRPYLQVS